MTKIRKATKGTEPDAGTEFQPDEYDAIAAAREESSTREEPKPEAATPDADPKSEEQDANQSKRLDPVELIRITLGPDNSSPKMRLFRNNRAQLLAVEFDEKPAEKYLQELREAGWRWRSDDKVWAKKLDRDQRWATQAEAEKLVHRIGNAIRGDLGLEPNQSIGR